MDQNPIWRLVDAALGACAIPAAAEDTVQRGGTARLVIPSGTSNKSRCWNKRARSIVAPTGDIMAQALTDGDQLISAEIGLDRCTEIRANLFDFEQHRAPEEYATITAAKTRKSPQQGVRKRARRRRPAPCHSHSIC